jgi:hypothetical protein
LLREARIKTGHVELRQQILELDGVQALEWFTQDSIKVTKDQVGLGFIRREPSTVMLDRQYVVFAVSVTRLQWKNLVFASPSSKNLILDR